MHAVLSPFDVTDDARLRLPQCAINVHSVHVGYVRRPTLQASQVVPVNPVEQVQVHAVLSPFDVTDAAWLLQWLAVVHSVHVGCYLRSTSLSMAGCCSARLPCTGCMSRS